MMRLVLVTGLAKRLQHTFASVHALSERRIFVKSYQCWNESLGPYEFK